MIPAPSLTGLPWGEYLSVFRQVGASILGFSCYEVELVVFIDPSTRKGVSDMKGMEVSPPWDRHYVGLKYQDDKYLKPLEGDGHFVFRVYGKHPAPELFDLDDLGNPVMITAEEQFMVCIQDGLIVGLYLNWYDPQNNLLEIGHAGTDTTEPVGTI